MTTAEALARFRAVYGLNKSAMAAAGGIAAASYTYENEGGAAPNVNVVINLAKKFNTSIDYILGLTDDARPVNQILSEMAAVQKQAAPADETSRLDELTARVDALTARLDRLEGGKN